MENLNEMTERPSLQSEIIIDPMSLGESSQLSRRTYPASILRRNNNTINRNENNNKEIAPYSSTSTMHVNDFLGLETSA